VARKLKLVQELNKGRQHLHGCQIDAETTTFEIPPQTLIILGRHSHLARRALSQIEGNGATHVTVLVLLLFAPGNIASSRAGSQ
jgi:hypothetical protein